MTVKSGCIIFIDKDRLFFYFKRCIFYESLSVDRRQRVIRISKTVY